MAAEELELAWAGITAPTTSGALAGRLAPDLDPKLGVTLAVDHLEIRHLLIPAVQSTEPPSNSATKGLEITVEELQVGEQPARNFLDVACADLAMEHNFTVVSGEVVDALRTDATDPLKTLKRILARWRWFWSVPAAGMSEEKMIGLFGELWFLEFWVGGADAETLAGWRGPFRDRHDFKFPAFSVEVKATRVRSDGAAVHHISTLDQLEDPEQGSLYLFSLRIRPDTLATHSLVASVDRARERLEGSAELLAEFDQLLGRYEYSPAHREKYSTTLRVVAEELYSVSHNFPRLTPETFSTGVPAGIDDISYTVDLAACQHQLVARAATDRAVEQLRDQLPQS